MRGRALFTISKPIFIIIAFIYKILPQAVAKCILQLNRYFPTIIGIAIRYPIVKALSRDCGNNVSIHDSVFFKHLNGVSFGDNVSIHPLSYIDGYGGVAIGNDVSIAHNVSILSFEHDYGDIVIPIKDADCIKKEVVIEDDVWLGAGVRVLGGVTIGKGSVIGAGAVVSRSIPPYSIAVGIPARVVKKRKDD